MDNYSVEKINLFNINAMIDRAKILFDCGKNMANDGLNHWNNGMVKTLLISVYSSFGNNVYIVRDNENNCVATFQTKISNESLHFAKLATKPSCSGKGIGSFCIKIIEKYAIESGCKKINLEVYDKSQHAIEFYMHKGYKKCGETRTFKYTEILMEKNLEWIK